MIQRLLSAMTLLLVFTLSACKNKAQNPSPTTAISTLSQPITVSEETTPIPPKVKVLEQKKVPRTFKGKATYYADWFHGRTTSNGEVYDKSKYTAAIRPNALSLLPGTMVEVTNIANGKKVVVKINDKMNTKVKAIIDLSYKAAEDLDLITIGITDVTIRVID